VVRYAGGPNAGHTLVVGNDKLIVRLIPSGILRPNTQCVLGQGMVIDPGVLVSEIDELDRRGLAPSPRLFVSDKAHLIVPFHIAVDTLRETSGGKAGRTLGTTKKGIGPAYEDKAARRGIRAGCLRDLPRCQELLEQAIAAWAPTLRALGGEVPKAADIIETLRPFAERIVPRLCDTSLLVSEALRAGKDVLLEGAQGTLLDIDHGTYPFVTSSSAGAGGAASGSGIGPTRIDTVLGITKAYATRVGEGPFPTELHDDFGEHLRKTGVEYGTTTGRPRRCGWYDAVIARYAARVNGVTDFVLTKLDVLTGLEQVPVCVAYDVNGTRHDEMPVNQSDFHHAVPVYEYLPGWWEDISEARTLEELPANARAYVQRVEELSGARISAIGVGPARDATILVHDLL
jgi:adenylosuccinate synthase